MVNRSPMSKALQNKRSNSIDLTITLGDGVNFQDDEAAKTLGLAPEGTELGDNEGNSTPMDGQAVKGSVDVAAPNDKMAMGEENPMHSDAQPGHLLIQDALAKAGLGRTSLAHRAMMKKPMTK